MQLPFSPYLFRIGIFNLKYTFYRVLSCLHKLVVGSVAGGVFRTVTETCSVRVGGCRRGRKVPWGSSRCWFRVRRKALRRPRTRSSPRETDKACLPWSTQPGRLDMLFSCKVYNDEWQNSGVHRGILHETRVLRFEKGERDLFSAGNATRHEF